MWQQTDDVVQGLALAQYLYENGHPADAHAVVVETLATARRLMSEIVDPDASAAVAPGALVRARAAGNRLRVNPAGA